MTANASGGAMLAYDMGCGSGKSKVIVDYINTFPIFTTLIVCPKSVISVWPREFEKHGATPVMVIPLTGGTIAHRMEEADRKLKLAEAMKQKAAVTINYEAVWRVPFASWVLGRTWDMIVADEIHRIKAPGGQASKFMAKLVNHSRRRVGLTGTPMPHSPLDVYGQYRFLDPGIYGTSFVRFRGRYAVMGGFERHQVVAYQNENELHRLFYSIAIRVQKSDVLDLPPVIHESRHVELGPEARRIYREVENLLIADVGKGVVTAANALARLLRLQQITSGFTVTTDGETVPLENAKADELTELLGDLPSAEPVVVFARFRHDLAVIRQVARQCGRRDMELSGSANDLAEWQAATGGEVLAVQIQSGGVGIDLTRAAYCVYYSMGYSLGDYIQSLARLDRPGQRRSVTYLHMVATGTVDRRVYRALRKREEIVESILEEFQQQHNSKENDDAGNEDNTTEVH